MCGAGCHGAAAELKVLSDRLKAPLIHSVKGQDMMPYDDPHWMGGIGMIGSKPVYNAVMSADLLLMVGTEYPYSDYLPKRPVVVQIDERPEVLGRRAPTVLGVLGSARPTLKLLVEQVAPKTTNYWDRVTEERRAWDHKLDRPFRQTHKNDFRDAYAIAEAVRRPSTRCVPVKTDDQLDLQALHHVRSRLVGQRTVVINQIRGFVLERGVAVRQGLRFLRQQLPEIWPSASTCCRLV